VFIKPTLLDSIVAACNTGVVLISGRQTYRKGVTMSAKKPVQKKPVQKKSAQKKQSATAGPKKAVAKPKKQPAGGGAASSTTPAKKAGRPKKQAAPKATATPKAPTPRVTTTTTISENGTATNGGTGNNIVVTFTPTTIPSNISVSPATGATPPVDVQKAVQKVVSEALKPHNSSAKKKKKGIFRRFFSKFKRSK